MALTPAQIHYYYYSGGGAPAPLVLGENVVEFSGAETEIRAHGSTLLHFPGSWWHNGRTYGLMQGNINEASGAASTYLVVYDEKDGVRKPYRVAGPAGLTPGGQPDSHSVPFGVVTDDGIYAFREETHDTPIAIFKGSDFNYFETLAEKINPGDGGIGEESSYHHLIKLPDGNWFSWCRMTKLFESYSGAHSAWVRSTNGLEDWGPLVRVSTNPRPITTTPEGDEEDKTRHYPVTLYYRQWYNNHLRVLVSQRTDNYSTGQGMHNLLVVYETEWVGSDGGNDFGYVWKNLIGDAYSHDIRDANYITETVMRDEFKVFDVGGDYNTRNSFIPRATMSESGVIYIINGDGESTGDLFLRIIKDRQINVKNLNIEDYVRTDPSMTQGHNVTHIAHLNGYLEIVVLIDEGDENVKHLFRSTDEGDTWQDISTLTCSKFPDNYLDIPNNRNFALFGSYNDSLVSGSSAIQIQRAAKGTIQTETPRIIIPTTNYSDAFDLFDYHGDGSALTKTGNNVTGLTDQFGLRNATGTNNPQWDGADAVTFNGTNNYFTIPTTGLTALSKVTFFAVVKTSGDNVVLLTFNDNTKTATFFGFTIVNPTDNTPAYYYKETSFALTTFDKGQSDLRDGAWHLLTFVIDGRCKADIYVDGKKEFYSTLNFDELEEYQKRGTLNFGTVNSIRIGSRDGSGTDAFYAFSFKQLMMKENVYSYDDQRGIERRIADLRGITLNYGYL